MDASDPLQARQKLGKLVAEASGTKVLDLPPHAVSGIKALCRQSDDNVAATFMLLMERVKAPHAQSRLMAVEMCHVLFMRSKAFRALMAPAFTLFLEWTLGFRRDNPLPPPADAAAALRRRTLAVVEQWQEAYGKAYKQISFGSRYLKETLKFDFPELPAQRAAHEAQRQRQQERTQAALAAKYDALVAELQERGDEVRDNLRQLQEATQLLQAAAAAADAAGRDDCGVAAGDDVGGSPVANARTVATDNTLQQADAAPEPEAAAAVAEDEGLEWEECDAAVAGNDDDAAIMGPYSPAVVAALREAVALLRKRHMPLLQEWLRVLTKVDAGAAGTECRAQRDRQLQEVIGLRQAAAGALMEYEALESSADLPSTRVWTGASPSDRGKAPAGTAPATASAAAGVPTPSSSAADAGPSTSGAAAPVGSPSSSKADQRSGQPAAPQATDAAQPRAVSPTGADDKAPVQVNPYASIKDPAAPKKRDAPGMPLSTPPKRQRSPAAASGKAQRGIGARDAATESRDSALPAELRAKLLGAAVVVDSSAPIVQHWEHRAVPSLTDTRGLEVYNHWGAVDVCKELGEARREELFGQMAAYYKPADPPRPPARQRPEAAAPPQGPAAQPQQAAASSTLAGAVCGGRQQADTASAGLDPWPSRSDACLNMVPGRAADRAYTDAVLAAGGGDEALALQLQEAGEAGLGRGNAGQGGRSMRGRGTPKLSIRARLERRLLSARAGARALDEVQHAENESHRDKYANRF